MQDSDDSNDQKICKVAYTDSLTEAENYVFEEVLEEQKGQAEPTTRQVPESEEKKDATEHIEQTLEQ